MSKRADRAIVGNIRVEYDAMIFDRDAVANARVHNARDLMDFTVFTDYGFSLDVNVRMYHAIAPDLRFAANVSMRRIDESDAVFNHQSPDHVSPEKVFELSKFRSGVDAGYFARVIMLVDSHQIAI